MKTIDGRRVLLASIIAQYHETFRRAIAAATLAVRGQDGVFVEALAEEGVFSAPRGVESLEQPTEAAANALYGEEPDGASLMDRTVEIVTAFLDNNR
ncbi:hypothetical protein NKI04_26375 [Mesorhizobium sp. M0814]|uniref:hypothetical protein n=1 Tax=Mesorhizobium sp. M0814 TaxID=2957004 RepID=UPI003335B41A